MPGHSRYERTAWAIGLSVAVHVLLWLLITPWLRSPPPAETTGGFGSVAMIPVAPPAPEPAAEPEPEPEPRRRHVAVEPPETEERPDDADFADRFDRRVERETVARPGGAPRPSESARRGAEDADGRRTTGASVVVGDAAMSDTPDESGDLARLDPGAAVVPTVIGEAAEAETGEGRPDAPGVSGEGIDLRVFNVAQATVAETPGEGGEFLELEEDDRTALNSVRSIYWSFFQRMREAIAAEWEPAREYRRHDPSGQRYRRIDRYTVLDVTLGADGSLRRAVVQRPAGLEFLDREALRAFTVASPFANVPEGLLDERGEARFRFGFYLSMDGSSRIRRLRY